MISNDSLYCLICEDCGCGVQPHEVRSHLSTSHPTAGFKVNNEELQQAIEDLDIAPSFPDLNSDIVYEEFAGLTLHVGIYCQECPKVMGTSGSANVHYSTAHIGITKPKNLPTGYYQKLRRGTNGALFRVNPQSKSVISSDEVLVEQLRAETDKNFADILESSDLNARAVTPWLISTKWHLHVEGHDPAELMALVKPLTKRENLRLVDLVNKYFRDACNLIDQTDELTLQYLNTPDSAKTYVTVNTLRFTSQ